MIPELIYSNVLSEFNLSSALSPINSIWTLDNEGALRVRPGGSPTKVDDHDPVMMVVESCLVTSHVHGMHGWGRIIFNWP